MTTDEGRELTVGVGAAAVGLDVDRVVDLGPMHPAAHGAYRLRLGLAAEPADDPEIVSAQPLVGHLHRGAEKLFEVRDYRQVLALANRHDWLAAFCNEMTVALAVERMVGMEVPPRAQWLRALLCELNRAMAHLVFLLPHSRFPDGAPGPATAGAVTAREALQAVLEEASGGRIHFMANRVGGLREDVPAGWTDRVLETLDVVDEAVLRLTSVTVTDDAFVKRHSGIGVLRREDALALGVTGPAGRASGVDLDLRRDDPLPPYAELDVLPVVRDTGDALARVAGQLDEVTLAATLARRCVDGLPAGAVNLRLPKTLLVPEGSVYVWTEAPLGVGGVYLVSRGERTPWRLKLRTPSFNNVQALAALLPGCRVSQLPTALASFALIVGDIDK